MAKSEGSGLVHRGFLLLALVAAIAVTVWAILLRPREQPLPAARSRPEPLTALVVVPAGAFPSSVGWGAVGELATMLPSRPGWDVRYNAAVALARHGTSELPFDVFVEMLDEEQQMRNRPTRLHDGRIVPDETAARRTVLQGLKAVSTWHKNVTAVRAADSEGVRRLHAAVEKLTGSGNLVVKTEAEKVKLGLRKG